MAETDAKSTPLKIEEIVGVVVRAVNESLPISKAMPIGVSVVYCFDGLTPTVISHGLWDDESLLIAIAVLRNSMMSPERVDIFVDNEPFELP